MVGTKSRLLSRTSIVRFAILSMASCQGSVAFELPTEPGKEHIVLIHNSDATVLRIVEQGWLILADISTRELSGQRASALSFDLEPDGSSYTVLLRDILNENEERIEVPSLSVASCLAESSCENLETCPCSAAFPASICLPAQTNCRLPEDASVWTLEPAGWAKSAPTLRSNLAFLRRTR
jgi:hypothetical protein